MRENNGQHKKRNFAQFEEENDNVCEGKNAVYELLRAGREIEKIYIATSAAQGLGQIIAKARENGIVVQECDKRKLDQMSLSGSHQGVIAITASVEYKSVDDILDVAKSRGEAPIIILCDGITDTHNLGAIIRTAEVSGAHGVVIPKRRSAGVNAACAKAAAGAIEHLAIAKVQNISTTIDSLKKQGIAIFGADMDGEKNIFESDFKVPMALVIGSEGNGISHLVKEKCDFLVNIPQKGQIPSLNASNAAAVMLYEILRQRDIVK